MKKWETLYHATMKLTRKYLKETVVRLVKSYLSEAEDTDNPFTKTPAADKGGEEVASADKSGEEKDKKEAKPGEPAGIPIKFNLSKVKKYNTAKFLSDSGIVKSIDKKGIIVTTQPDQVDVLVNFDDISENAKSFFKNRK